MITNWILPTMCVLGFIATSAWADNPKPRPCIKPEPAAGDFELNPKCEGGFDLANLSWITADQIYLARVTPSPETINKLSAYEFFAGHDGNGKVVWT